MDATAVARDFAAILGAALGERCRGIALFGSQARGTARPDSDIDLLVIADGLAPDPLARAAELRRPVLERTEPVAVLARTSAEFEADVTPLHLDLALDAIVLAERDAYLTTRLAQLRCRLDEAGLWRDADLTWRWRRLPTVANWAIGWDGVRV
ncbi:MAG TPA: nucleotidyltransferase domain-containing protein [Polyangia bacterium]|jgi:hypothetical protein